MVRIEIHLDCHDCCIMRLRLRTNESVSGNISVVEMDAL